MKEVTYTVKAAWKEVGGLSDPSKMPGYGTSLPAQECNVGSKLVKISGSVCSECYALKGNYIRFKHVGLALYRRLYLMQNNPEWLPAMVFLINWYGKKTRHFRWHDSGDIQDREHLIKIRKIATLTPSITHWLPTREAKIVKEHIKEFGSFPENLIVRVSATMINGKPHKFHKHTSTVVTDRSLATGWVCPSSKQGNKCMECRACWDKGVRNISYIKH